MKALILVLFFVSQITGFCYGQDTTKVKTRKNELKLNVFNLLLFRAADINYDRIINENWSTGVGVLAKINKDDAMQGGYGTIEVSNNRIWSVTLFLRRYFSKTYARGLFIEGFGMLNRGEIAECNTVKTGQEPIEVCAQNKYTRFALGVSFGGKFVLDDNSMFEIYFGIGENLRLEEPVTRGGLSVGYRF